MAERPDWSSPPFAGSTTTCAESERVRRSQFLGTMAMADRDQPTDLTDGLKRSVRLRRERRERAQREGERSLAQNLAWVGTLGWLIVTPILAGMFLGRFIDRRFGLGILFSSTLCCIGAVIGGWLAWRRIRRS